MRLKSCIAAAGCTAAILAVGGGPAFAGEYNGKGEPIGAPSHANSICVFSGQNNEALEGEPGRVQSYGQLVRAGLKGTAEAPSPGFACNGHTGFLAGGRTK